METKIFRYFIDEVRNKNNEMRVSWVQRNLKDLNETIFYVTHHQIGINLI